MFCPEGDGVPNEVGSVRLELAVLALAEADGEDAEDVGAFVSDVGLEASVDWRGAIRDNTNTNTNLISQNKQLNYIYIFM